MKKFALIAGAAFGLLMLPALSPVGSTASAAGAETSHVAATVDLSARHRRWHRRWHRSHRSCWWHHGRRVCRW